MKGPNHHSRHEERRERVATLVRSVSVRLVEVSRGGCRLESSSRLESGSSGLLAVDLAGLTRIDDIRVARCEPRVGAGAVFQVGVELLRTRRFGRRSVRMAIRQIISNCRDMGHARQDDEVQFTQDVPPGDEDDRSEGRGPPAVWCDRGS